MSVCALAIGAQKTRKTERLKDKLREKLSFGEIFISFFSSLDESDYADYQKNVLSPVQPAELIYCSDDSNRTRHQPLIGSVEARERVSTLTLLSLQL
jgi:hypothetical protein